jgi:preprotein translocase subunit SecF
MWLLNFVPEEWIRWAIHGIVALGAIMYLASTFVKMLTSKLAPSIAATAMGIRLLGAAMLIAGIYFEGGYGVEMEWRHRVDEMQQRIQQAQEASTAANAALEQAQRDRAQAIAQSTILIQSRIQAQREQINNACRIDPVAIDLYNQSISGPRSQSR